MYFLIEKVINDDSINTFLTHKCKLESDPILELASQTKRRDDSMYGLVYSINVYHYPVLLYFCVHRRVCLPTPLKLGVVV